MKALRNLGIETYFDLLNHIPFRYIDYRRIKSISELVPQEICTIQGVVAKTSYLKIHSGSIQSVTIEDKTARINAVWFNQPFILRIIKKGMSFSLSGKMDYFSHTKNFFVEEYEPLHDAHTSHTARLLPVYGETRGVSSRTIREKMNILFDYIKTKNVVFQDFFDINECKKYGLIDIDTAYRFIHYPSGEKSIEDARKRLSFNELFFLHLRSIQLRRLWNRKIVSHTIRSFKFEDAVVQNLIKTFPFILTHDQIKCIQEILHDLSLKNPMNRFLQGDVGSGKTVVAVVASYITALSNLQVLYMAPTEILAHQQYNTFKKLLSSFPHIKIAVITSSFQEHKKAIDSYHIIIGTQALLQSSVRLSKTALVIIDEQHRFGVKQRALLTSKGGSSHLLTMTATPIPRTVSLVLWGNLDISLIAELPKGRKPVKTHLIPHSKRKACYEWIKAQINKKHLQVFIVCPLIDEGLNETTESVKAVLKEYTFLQNTEFKDFSVGLLHGRLKSDEKKRVMELFQKNKIQILVTTSVVEVGIDIPNAAIMIIEGAERFGLAALHQLRGRIGRGVHESYCFLFTTSEGPEVSSRLTYFSKNQKGIDLAEYDLKTRGPGTLFGVKQHGYEELKIARFNDYPLIKLTQKASQEYDLKKAHENPFIKQNVLNKISKGVSKD